MADELSAALEHICNAIAGLRKVCALSGKYWICFDLFVVSDSRVPFS